MDLINLFHLERITTGISDNLYEVTITTIYEYLYLLNTYVIFIMIVEFKITSEEIRIASNRCWSIFLKVTIDTFYNPGLDVC